MLSYAKGPDSPLLETTISEAFRETVGRLPEHLALISRHQNLRLTFAELSAEVERAARGLAGLGLGARDRIGVWSSNCVEWVVLNLACARIGAVLVNVNPAYRAYELAFVLKKSGIKALFLWERDSRSDYNAILQEAMAAGNHAIEHAVYFGTGSWDSMLANGADIARVEVAADDVTNIQYTSGTTGSPKGVLLTHRNLVNNAAVISGGMKITEQDRVAVPVPLYHCFGSVAGTLVMVVEGATMILPAATFDPLATMEAIHEERATAIYGVPTMFIAELEHAEFRRFDFTSLRTGVMAGAPCPIEVMKRVVNEMHCPEMTIMYGQTESSPVITMSSVEDSLERRVSTVGAACPNTEVKIAAAGGDTVPVGEQGELCTRGYLVMKGYDQEPEATKRAVDEDGWLHTGDLATMRPDGYFRVTGRAKDMIIRGGENIYPREVEEFLYTHPKVADVQVIGLPDAKLGETVAAWIRVKEPCTEDEIREHCQGRIAHFKIPQFIRFVDVFPMTVTGKIQKFKMREVEIQERGLEAVSRIQTA
ncbi:MAG TPA: AMP-binding protein [Bryobacteraceae bacterium]|jgi:fatty-acyl-CoA synthase|nr:AMP-binding protein [Bryobacteraceae bacterium]